MTTKKFRKRINSILLSKKITISKKRIYQWAITQKDIPRFGIAYDFKARHIDRFLNRVGQRGRPKKYKKS